MAEGSRTARQDSDAANVGTSTQTPPSVEDTQPKGVQWRAKEFIADGRGVGVFAEGSTVPDDHPMFDELKSDKRIEKV